MTGEQWEEYHGYWIELQERDGEWWAFIYDELQNNINDVRGEDKDDARDIAQLWIDDEV